MSKDLNIIDLQKAFEIISQEIPAEGKIKVVKPAAKAAKKVAKATPNKNKKVKNMVVKKKKATKKCAKKKCAKKTAKKKKVAKKKKK